MLRRVERAAARRRIGPVPPEAGAESLAQIQHIVVLMMENHSYDNYLGMLAGRGDGFALGADGRPDAANPSNSGVPVQLRHSPSVLQQDGVPSQSWHASHLQYAGGACDGFVRSLEDQLPQFDSTAGMQYWTESELPFYYGLARTFPLATRWFSSCLGPTFPNRRFLISGTAHGLLDDLPFGMIDYPEAGTIFDHLDAHGISWVNYHHVPQLRVSWRLLSRARGLKYLRLLLGAIGGAFGLLLPWLASKVNATAEIYPLGLLRTVNHLRPAEDFFTAARAGALPSVSIVDPDFQRTSEENPQNIQDGEYFAARVINAVMAGPGWPRTLLVWLYDEHGGYYDHVPPPAAPAPDDQLGLTPYERYPFLGLLRNSKLGQQLAEADAGPRSYERLGFRVPAVIVSPYARPDYVTSQVYDHTAILRLIQRKWSLPPLTRRDAAAADLLEVLDLDGPGAFMTPPVLPPPARIDDPQGDI
jgi:phospholipase C